MTLTSWGPFLNRRGGCRKARPGWYCSRRAGHVGPCAAWPGRGVRIRYLLTGVRMPW